MSGNAARVLGYGSLYASWWLNLGALIFGHTLSWVLLGSYLLRYD